MPLTPEDVVNKRFQPTKFREGYDQDEVDDFLDEIVVELRRVNHENEDLRQRLLASEARIAELQRSGAGLVAQMQAPAIETAVTPSSFPEPVADIASLDSSNTNNLLQLARKLHDEHVAEGMAKRDSLIARDTQPRPVWCARQRRRSAPSSAASSARRHWSSTPSVS